MTKSEPGQSKGTPAGDPGYDYSSGAAELRGEVYRPPEYLQYLERATVAMRTIQLVVYAGMASFVILAFYGFFLVYRLTGDVHRMVDQMELVTQQIQSITRIMANMDGSVSGLNDSVASLTTNVETMDGNMATMTHDLRQMGNTVALMQHSARNLDQAIGPTMGLFNQMMPFGASPSTYGGAPPYAPPVR